MPTDNQLLDILQKLADALEALKAEVKAISDKVNGTVTPTPESPIDSWVDVFRKVWQVQPISEWPTEWGAFPWNKYGVITEAVPLKVGVESETQKALIIKFAKWGFSPGNPVSPSAWSLSDLYARQRKLKDLLSWDEAAWENSVYAKNNVEPDLVAFLTCLGQFDPTDPMDTKNFGTSPNRLDKLQNENLDHILKRDYFNTHQGGGPGQGGE